MFLVLLVASGPKKTSFDCLLIKIAVWIRFLHRILLCCIPPEGSKRAAPQPRIVPVSITGTRDMGRLALRRPCLSSCKWFESTEAWSFGESSDQRSNHQWHSAPKNSQGEAAGPLRWRTHRGRREHEDARRPYTETFVGYDWGALVIEDGCWISSPQKYIAFVYVTQQEHKACQHK